MALKKTEIITLAYIILTGVYVLVFSSQIENVSSLLGARAALAALILGFAYSKRYADSFLRYAFPLALIIYWYPETYYINECFFSNLDHVFANIDKQIFGYQPALEFSKALPYRWFSELMSFGYFSYFLTVTFIAVYLYFTNKQNGEKAIFIILCSFFLYYILFIILPVIGPQFYFNALGEPVKPVVIDAASAGSAYVPDGYLFRYLLVTVQSMAEKPTGAFPSSHVGMSLIFLIMIWKYARRYFVYFTPIVVVLIFSTIYIKAHYVIDVIGGVISAPIIYLCANFIMKQLPKKYAE